MTSQPKDITDGCIDKHTDIPLFPSEMMMEIDPKVQKRLLLKLDLRLISFGFFSYLTSNLVRNNMQNAYTNGMDKDVELTSEAYNWCVTFFFIGYIIPQIPTNMIVSRILPRYFLPTTELIWGIATCFIALVKTANAVWGLRFIQGLAQAAYFPPMIFIISSWYTHGELATRTALFMAGNQMSGALGGIIAAGINTHLQGVQGLASWQWLYIIEGVMCIGAGLAGYWLLPNYPHNTSWIQGEEKACAIARLERQNGGKVRKMAQKYSWQTFKNVLATPYAYILTLAFICLSIGSQFLLYFTIILKDMGWSNDMANYLVSPVFGFAAIIGVVMGKISDHFGERAWMIIIVQSVVSLFYLLLFVVYGAASPFWLIMLSGFIITLNMAIFPIVFAFINEIFALDENTRALAIACINCIGNLVPNFITVGAWVVTDSPNFFMGKVVNFAMSVASIVLMIVCWWCVKHQLYIPGADRLSQKTVIEKEEEIVA